MEYINSVYKNIFLFLGDFPLSRGLQGQVYVSALCRGLSDLSLGQDTALVPTSAVGLWVWTMSFILSLE